MSAPDALIDVQDATARVLATAHPLRAERVPLEEATGRILRETVAADRDFPPYDRVMADGYALSWAAYSAGQRTYRLQGRQVAGAARLDLGSPDACIEVMTGAMMPAGADLLVLPTDVVLAEENHKTLVHIQAAQALPEQHIHRQGSDQVQGAALLHSGMRIGPAELAVAAAVGQPTLLVSRLPRIALVSTGDELVPVFATPLPHQIRRSNTYSLLAALQRDGFTAETFHLPDNPEAIHRRFNQLLADFDVIVLSGGVSQGKADYIPEALDKLHIPALFHGVAQRPGRSFRFGVSAKGQPVFALPGNPVPAFVGYYRYVRRWLFEAIGLAWQPLRARLAADFAFEPPLTYFLQVQITADAEGHLLAYPQPGNGSGDFTNLLASDGFLELPADRQTFAAGEVFPLYTFRDLPALR
ncbi:MAG: molybdopterin molybdotransferase MoeA [Bacteroidia bacterium]